MTLCGAAVLLLLAAAGIPLSRALLRDRPRLRLGCTLVCILIILACGAYLGAGLLLLSAVQNQPPPHETHETQKTAALPFGWKCGSFIFCYGKR